MRLQSCRKQPAGSVARCSSRTTSLGKRHRYAVRVVVTGLTFRGAASDAPLSTTTIMTVDVLDVNEPPTLPSSMTAAVEENVADGTLVGDALLGFDVDLADDRALT